MLEEMVKRGASDLHLKAGSPPALRLDGQIERLDLPPLGVEELEALGREVMSPTQFQQFQESRDLDFSFGVKGLARFRANFCRQRGTVAATLRVVPMKIPSLEDLQLPVVLQELALRPRGLLLVTGTVGSGKSTTLAAVVGHINQHRRAKVVTVEDPIEFLHIDQQSQILQREVGTDTAGFASALRYALRQDPDVIMVGEIRDAETMGIALTAANTGHLVLSTLHTVDAAQTVNRIISFFPPHQHRDVRYMVSSCLLGVVSLRLVARASGEGRVPAVELLVATPTIREYLVEPEKTGLIGDCIAEGASQYGMQTFDQSLLRLFHEGKITREEALRHASRPSDFELSLQGIQRHADLGWQESSAARP